MKNKIILIILTIYILSIISAVPKIEPYVNDFANLLTSEQETNLNLYIDEIEKNTSWEIAIVTVENTEGQERVEYANKIGDENGVGKLDKDNGVVLLYSLENEAGGAIATGRYSESILNDAKVGRIGREAKPLCDEEKYYYCFFYIVQEIEKEIKGEYNNETNLEEVKEKKELPTIDGVLIFIAIVIFGFVFFGINGNSSSGGSGGSSFGGGSFGGGGSGF